MSMEPAEGATECSYAVEWDSRWSREARQKLLPQVQSITAQYTKLPGIIGMHGGLPPSDTFPFATIECRLSAAASTRSSSSSGGSTGAADKAAAADAITAVMDPDMLVVCNPELVAAAQQYNMHLKGYPPLQALAHQLVCQLHQPATLAAVNSSNSATHAADNAQNCTPTGSTVQAPSIGSNSPSSSSSSPIGMDVVMTPGSSAALDALVRVLCGPGDPVLVEEFTYSHHAEAHLLSLG
eukprot:GHRR01019520.1.p1 GENE.GHRR01019520.1~~GHRR01019520.1.p1  ORF type:complete len:239 (+),score=101.08 GHRR01019520.1:268-984(+)